MFLVGSQDTNLNLHLEHVTMQTGAANFCLNVAHCGGNMIIMKHKRPELPGYLGAKQKPNNPRVVYIPLKISQLPPGVKCKDDSSDLLLLRKKSI